MSSHPANPHIAIGKTAHRSLIDAAPNRKEPASQTAINPPYEKIKMAALR